LHSEENVKIRRVVTGHDASGKAVFASDSEVDAIVSPLMPGCEFHRMWSLDEAPTFPDEGVETPGTAWYPPVGGVRFAFFTLPPADTTPPPPDDLDFPAVLADIERQMPGILAPLDPNDPGMHKTDTVDFEVVVSGELWLELDDGVATLLKPGDTVVQNGTRHRWTNKGATPAVLALFLTGAKRAG
jgi:mannose-6-phosphate isomerase-like protein (cupin superfamily)